MFEEHSKVALSRDLPELGLKKGDIGWVVDIQGGGQAYMLEFLTFGGDTIGVVEVEPDDIHRANESAVPHERERIDA